MPRARMVAVSKYSTEAGRARTALNNGKIYTKNILCRGFFHD